MKKGKELEVVLVGGKNYLGAVLDALRGGCEKPEMRRVLSWGSGSVWCIVDGGGTKKKASKYKVVYHLAGELPEDKAEAKVVDEIVVNYAKRELWRDDKYKGL